MEELAQLLSSGLQQLELNINLETQQKLLAYVALLQKWNQAYNLTAIKDPTAIVIRHILDSLAIAQYITADLVLDVGTGAGFPGIPLALIFPHKKFVLLDSNGKKTRFLQHVKLMLAINNITIVQERVEKFIPEAKFPCITSRAVGSIADLVASTQHLLTPDGKLILMKGKVPEQELSCLSQPVVLEKVAVPFLSEARCLVII